MANECATVATATAGDWAMMVSIMVTSMIGWLWAINKFLECLVGPYVIDPLIEWNIRRDKRRKEASRKAKLQAARAERETDQEMYTRLRKLGD